VTISVPATSANLGPGFDTLGLSLALRNKVHIQPSTFFSVSIKGEGANNPRLKGNNLFINIFNDHYRHLTGKKGLFRFKFYNKIPLSRGLGSSSAVIVSAIASAYSAAGVNITKRKLLNLAAVVVIPDKPISTAYSRTTLPRSYRKEDAIYNLGRASLLTACFFNESWEMLRVAARDRFHQAARMKNLPELFEVQKIAIENNALMSTLSGSGSTFFNMTYKEDAESLLEKYRKRFPNFRSAIYDFDNDGVIFG